MSNATSYTRRDLGKLSLGAFSVVALAAKPDSNFGMDAPFIRAAAHHRLSR